MGRQTAQNLRNRRRKQQIGKKLVREAKLARKAPQPAKAAAKPAARAA